jgi:hypothetical protein
MDATDARALWARGPDGIGPVLAEDVEFDWWSGAVPPCRGRDAVVALLRNVADPESGQLPAMEFENLPGGVVLACDTQALAAEDAAGLAVVIYTRGDTVIRMVQYASRAQARSDVLEPDNTAGDAVAEPEWVRSAVEAIRTGDVALLEERLAQHPELATMRIGKSGSRGMSRTLLHVATDWPGHYPHGTRTVEVLVAAGADVNARFIGPHRETPLHWAASSDDVAVLDALLDAGADIDADGAVIANGTALADATAFGQWNAARRLVERGARVGFGEAASLGLLDALSTHVRTTNPSPEELTSAFWMACHGSQKAAAHMLLDLGADPNWVGYDGLTALDAADRSGATDVVEWLRGRGGVSARPGSPRM